MRSYTQKKEGGYTFAEMLTTVAVFSVLMVAIIGVFTSVLNAQRRVTAQRKVLQDMRFAVESVERDIRTGKIDYAKQQQEQPPFDGATELNLFTQNGDFITYSVSGGVLMRGNDQITTSDVQIQKVRFYIHPEDSSYAGGSADEQSRVTVYVEAEADVLGEVSEMDFQTTVASRVYEK